MIFAAVFFGLAIYALCVFFGYMLGLTQHRRNFAREKKKQKKT